MRHRKLLRILADLNPEEARQFHQFLQSPLHNSNGRILRLYELLDRYYLSTEEEGPGPEALWEMGLSTGPYRANGFDRLCAELLASLNEFFAWLKFQEQNSLKAQLQMEAYVDRGLDEWVPGLFRNLSQRYQEDFQKDPEGMFAQMKLLRSHSVFLLRQPRTPRGESLLEIDQALTQAYLAQKLEVAAGLATLNQIFNLDLTLPDEAFMVRVLEERAEDFPPFIRLQYLGYLTAAHRSDQHYHALRESLDRFREEVPRDEAGHLYRLALNHCFFRLNEEDPAFLPEADTLLMKLWEEGWLLQDGKLPPEMFKNLSLIRLRNGHQAWVRDFLAEWGQRLTQDHAGAALQFGEGALAFFEQDYDLALSRMESVLRDFKADVYYGMDARIFQIKALYERNRAEDVEELESRLNAFRIFVRRNKKLGEIDQYRYRNFVKLIRRLVSIRFELPDKRIRKTEKFLSDLLLLQPASNLDWFQAMAGQLLGVRKES